MAEILTNRLTESQLYMLKIMANINEDELIEIKHLIRKYLAAKLTKEADNIWEKNGWSQKDEEEFLQLHLRTSYKHNG